MRRSKKVCEPAPAYPHSVAGRNVTFNPVGLTIDKWDAERKIYVPQGLVAAQALSDKEFGPMTHGPKIRSADVKSRHQATATAAEFSASLPPVYFTATCVPRRPSKLCVLSRAVRAHAI